MPLAAPANPAVVLAAEVQGDILRYSITWDPVLGAAEYIVSRYGDDIPYGIDGRTTKILVGTEQVYDYLLSERPTKYQIAAWRASDGLGDWTEAVVATPKHTLERRGHQLLIRRVQQWARLIAILGSADKVRAGHPDIRRDLAAHGGKASDSPYITIARVKGAPKDAQIALNKIDDSYPDGSGGTTNVHMKRTEAFFEVRAHCREPDQFEDMAGALDDAFMGLRSVLIKDGIRHFTWARAPFWNIGRTPENSPPEHILFWQVSLEMDRTIEVTAEPVSILQIDGDSQEGFVFDLRIEDAIDAEATILTLEP